MKIRFTKVSKVAETRQDSWKKCSLVQKTSFTKQSILVQNFGKILSNNLLQTNQPSPQAKFTTEKILWDQYYKGITDSADSAGAYMPRCY